MPHDHYRLATRADLDLAITWATDEGWNPSPFDAHIFYQTDPEGFVCIERDGDIIGTGSIIRYPTGDFGFMGFFIVRKDLRNQGIGAPFWHWRLQRLRKRLHPGATIGMDGVFDMQPFYAKGGFKFTHRNIRMEGIGKSAPTRPAHLIDLATIPFAEVAAFDRHHFGYDRASFLRSWITPQDGLALGAIDSNNHLTGCGVIRRCDRGHKIGPLFANAPDTADALFTALGHHAAGAPTFLDIPENNPAARTLTTRHGMKEVFGCARMYDGPIPKLPWHQIYGVTTFELG